MSFSIDSQELSEYLKALTEGGLKIFVAKAEGQYNKEEISKIKIPIRRKSSASIGFVSG